MTEPHKTEQGLYPVDAENIAEMARLTRQAKVFTTTTGLLPDGFHLKPGQKILDLGCGPGEWAITLAQAFPTTSITGIDISQTMTDYARYQAEQLQMPIIDFRVMDACQRLDFPDASFDLIHTRLVAGFLTPARWSALLAECYRILKPGGYMISVESNDVGSSSSPSLTRLMSLVMKAMHRTGHYFGYESDHSAVAVVLPHLMQTAGFTIVRREAMILDYSSGSVVHEEMIQDWKIVLALCKPLCIRTNVISAEEFDILHARALEDMSTDDFCAALFLQRLWVQKPE
jgi:ubiquinone/menaquinone biosynthesis C-methylase UbiE